MPPLLNIIGKKFHRLIVLERIPRVGDSRWKCKCDCGNTTSALGYNLKNGAVKSCGCLQREEASKSMRKRKTTHGMARSRQYKIWNGIKNRCLNIKSKEYKRYGMRGIKICDRWLKFENFWKDMENGYKTNLSIERINNNGNYCKENCKWATMKEQQNNRRSNTPITFNGLTLNLHQWAKKTGIKPNTIMERLKRGWTVKKALTRPVGITFHPSALDFVNNKE